MIIVTGGAGFIGSCLVKHLNELNYSDIIIVDDFESDDKTKNCRKLKFEKIISIEEFIGLIEKESLSKVEVIFHMGAISSTLEKNEDLLIKFNTEYTKKLVLWSIKNNVRLIYASSASVYGNGNLGYDDEDKLIPMLNPLNMYGNSKKQVDEWVISNKLSKKVVGLRFFNVYGPNEYHKKEMQSVVKKGFEEIRKEGKIHLFKSYRHGYKDGEQKRDFIYVKDVIDVMVFFWKNQKANGIFNVGTGKARTWNELALALFRAMNLKPNIIYKEMPDSLQKHYQYFTEAKVDKLRRIGYNKPFTTLEEGIKDYVQNYLMKEDSYF